MRTAVVEVVARISSLRGLRLGSNRGLRLKPVSGGPSRVDERAYGKLGFLGNREVAARDLRHVDLRKWIFVNGYDERINVRTCVSQCTVSQPCGRTREAKSRTSIKRAAATRL